MPLSLELTRTQKMSIIIIHWIAYIKAFTKPILLAIGGFTVAWFDEMVLLQIEEIANIDIAMPFAKVFSSFIAIALSGMSGWYAYGKYRNTNQDQYKRNVDWLIERGFLDSEASVFEIKKTIKDHFG